MKKAILLGLGIFVVGLMVGVAQAADPFAVGEKWAYKHEGAVPFRPPDFTISGDRIREVVAVQGENEKKRWQIQEKWGDNDEFAGKRIISADRMYDRIESGEDRVMTIEPATFHDFLNLKPGEEKKLEVTFKFGGGDMSFPMSMTAKRVKDETIKVPAGEFKDCIHVEIEETSTFTPPNADKVTMTTKREQWYHSKVNGLVKEITTLGRPDGQSDKGTSELKSYTKEKKEENKEEKK